MKQLLLQFALNKPKWVFILTLLITLVAGVFIPKIVIDTDPENMLREEQQDRAYHNQIKKRFNLYDAIVVGAVNEQSIFNVKSLAALETLVAAISDIDGVIVPDMMALPTVDNITQEGVGTIRFEWMMKKAPSNQQQADWINQNVDRLPLFQNTLVSEDDKATAIYVPIKDKDESYRISTEIQTAINQLDSDDEYHITGLPVAEDTFGYQMFVQMGISAPLAAMMIFVLMWIFFRNIKFIAAPMIIAMATVIITMGLMIGLGFTVHIMSSMIPIFLMPIAVVDSIHIMSEFSDNYKQESKKNDVIKKVVGHLFKPMLFTSVTSATGFLSLMLTPIPPVQAFGAFVAFGILLAFILTIVFIPAYLSVLKPKSLASLQKGEVKSSILTETLEKLGAKSIVHSKAIILFFGALIALSIWGISKIEINDNPVRWFKADHPIRIADKILNDHFAGTYDAYLVLEADTKELKQDYDLQIASIKDLALQEAIYSQQYQQSSLANNINQVIVTIEDYLFETDLNDQQQLQAERLLEKMEKIKVQLAYFQQPQALSKIEQLQAALQSSGYVGKSNSLADVVKVVNRELRSGKESDYRLPENQNGVAQALLQYQSSHRPQDLWHMTSKDYSSSVIWLQLKSGDNQDMSRVKNYLEQYIKQNPFSDNVKVKWAGKTYLNMVWQDEMVKGMVSSLISAFIVVLIMMIMLFRSVWFGLLAMLPLTITIAAIYGLIGWVGKDYDMPIAVLSALTLGLSVDFAIHFLQRARDIYSEEKDFKVTMLKMFEEPANAISRNAIVIALGFTPLLVAPLMPYVTVGFFLASIMAVSALVTLILLPNMLKLLSKKILN
ncbi:MAG: MMPL family transporter [Kangiellaceae bacterium]|nr:MMPL family transporter [Kangiellaceae bacterium]